MVTTAAAGKADGNEEAGAVDVVSIFEEDVPLPTVAALVGVPAVPPPPPQAVNTLAAISATAIGLIARNSDWLVCAMVMGRFVRFMFTERKEDTFRWYRWMPRQQ